MNAHLTYEQKSYRNATLKINRFEIQSDEFSPFRIFSKRVRQAAIIRKYGDSDIDPDYLRQLWISQKGRCAYTGIEMLCPKNITEYHKVHSVKKLSLDRIDSSKGYTKGNVHFVCQAINLAKKNLPHKEMVEFIKEIKLVEPPGNDPGSLKLLDSNSTSLSDL